MEGFMQHDVQELNRVLCDNLEEKMKVRQSTSTFGQTHLLVSKSALPLMP